MFWLIPIIPYFLTGVLLLLFFGLSPFVAAFNGMILTIVVVFAYLLSPIWLPFMFLFGILMFPILVTIGVIGVILLIVSPVIFVTLILTGIIVVFVLGIAAILMLFSIVLATILTAGGVMFALIMVLASLAFVAPIILLPLLTFVFGFGMMFLVGIGSLGAVGTTVLLSGTFVTVILATPIFLVGFIGIVLAIVLPLTLTEDALGPMTAGASKAIGETSAGVGSLTLSPIG
jgi:hypothetical protein